MNIPTLFRILTNPKLVMPLYHTGKNEPKESGVMWAHIYWRDVAIKDYNRVASDYKSRRWHIDLIVKV